MVTAFLNERQATTKEMALVSNALAAYSFIAGKNKFGTLLLPLHPHYTLYKNWPIHFYSIFNYNFGFKWLWTQDNHVHNCNFCNGTPAFVLLYTLFLYRGQFFCPSLNGFLYTLYAKNIFILNTFSTFHWKLLIIHSIYKNELYQNKLDQGLRKCNITIYSS